MSLLARLFSRRARAPAPSGPAPADPAPPEPWRVPYDGVATEADVQACFRLLLGRHCSAAEWPGHSARAGAPLDDVVRDFLSCREFAERGLVDAAAPEDVVRAELADFVLYSREGDGEIGAPARAGRYEPHVAAALRRTLGPGDAMLDVGANIGYFTLLAAGLVGPAGHVTAMEPNPENVALMERSVAESGFGNVTVIQAGASAAIGTLALHAASGNGATSAYDPTRGARRTAAGLPIDVALSRRAAPLRLIKIDVEGFEFEALRGAERVLAEDRPVLLLEFAPEGLVGTDGPGLLAWLAARGYGFSVLEGEGPGAPRDAAGVMEAFARAGVDHIDIVASPEAPPPD